MSATKGVGKREQSVDVDRIVYEALRAVCKEITASAPSGSLRFNGNHLILKQISPEGVMIRVIDGIFAFTERAESYIASGKAGKLTGEDSRMLVNLNEKTVRLLLSVKVEGRTFVVFKGDSPEGEAICGMLAQKVKELTGAAQLSRV